MMTTIRSLTLALLGAAMLILGGTVQAAGMGKFTLSSSSIKANKTIPQAYAYKGYGCTGDDVSPELSWKNPPAGTKSFAVTVFDPDAPTGSGWWHWVVVNIPADKTTLARGFGNDKPDQVSADGILQTRNDYGTRGWGGPCPPAGAKPHRYIFTVYALKALKLDVPGDASGALVGFMIHFNKIGKASFKAYYGRK